MLKGRAATQRDPQPAAVGTSEPLLESTSNSKCKFSRRKLDRGNEMNGLVFTNLPI